MTDTVRTRRYGIAAYGIPTAVADRCADETLASWQSVAIEIRAQLGVAGARHVRGRVGDRIRAWLAVRGIPTTEQRERARGAA